MFHCYSEASLALTGETLFASLSDGRLAAYAAIDGRLLWGGRAGGSRPPPEPTPARRRAARTPHAGWRRRLEAATGEQRWVARLLGRALQPVAGDETVYVRLFEGAVVALDAEDGDRRWTADVGRYGVSSLVGPADGRVYLSGSGGTVALDATTGAPLWEWTAEDVFVSPLVADGILYVGTMAGDLFVLDPAMGTELVRVPLGCPVINELMTAGDDLLLAFTRRDETTSVVAIRRPHGGT